MAKYSNVVTYDIKTTLNTSGITKLRSELNKLNQEVTAVGKTQWGLKDSEIQRTVAQVNRLQNAITECFNPKIGLLDLSKFNKTLEQEKALLGTINTDWAKMGAQGTRAINSLASSVLNLNKGAITVNSTLSKIANTFGNTVRWGITASIFQEMMSSVQGAVSYMKDLDESLTNIQMVTNSSKEDMRELAQYANNAAQALGSTTVDYTNAVKVFVQEGFSESESKQYANLSTKLANVSEQSTAVTSDQITAYRNAFQLDYQQTAEAMDKVANVANNTASNVNELMTASQRAASVAQAVGSSQDSFLAAIATIESVTRQSAEEIGNGLKTIYQRFADIKVSGSTDDGVDYGQYAKALQQVGVDVLDVSGQFKGMDQILKELQDVWSELDDTMKIAVGEKVAGKFQYNRFAALMNNPEYYQKALGATQGASGMMDQMNEYYVEGIEGRMKTLQAAGEQIMSTLFNQDDIEPIIEAATNFLNIINNIIDSVGGGLPVFTALSGILLRTFNSQIAEQAARITTNIQTSAQISKNSKLIDTTFGKIQGLQNERGDQQGSKAIGEIRETFQNQGGLNGLSENSREKMTEAAQNLLEAENKVAEVKEKQKLLQEQINADLTNIPELADIALQEEKKEYEIAKKNLELEKTKLDAEITFGDLSDEEIDQREKSLKVMEDEVDATRIKYEQTQSNVFLERDLNTYTLDELKAIDQKNKELDQATNYAEQYLKLTQEATEVEGNEQAARQNLEGQNENAMLEKRAASITNLVAGLTSAVTLATSLYSVWQLWNNEDASFEEKVVGTLSSLTMILPLAITSYQALTAVKWADVTASATSVAVAGKDIIVKELQAIANSTLAKTTGAATVAQWALNAAMNANPIGLVVAAIAALIAIISGAIAIYINWQNSIHAASKEFEAQKELLNKTKKNYSDLRDEVESLKQSMDSLKETRSSLEDLTEGTDEWREAVRKLNDQVLTLLQTYPELAQYVKNEDGVLSIDDVGMDQFYQQQLNKADHLASVNSVQQINTLQAQNKKYVEDFSNKWGLSKEEISSAIEKGAYSLEGKSDLLNASFAELVNKVQINSTSIDNLSDNIGTLNTTYSDYSSKEDINLDEVKEAIREQYGTDQYDEYGNSIGTKLDFSTMTNNQEFLDAVAEATGKNIVGATDTSWFDGNVKFKTNDGDEFEYTTDQLLNLLADSQAAIDATNRKLEENRIIYEAFGARYDEASKKFINSSGETVSSLEDLNGVTSDEIAAIKAFQDGIYNDIAVKDFYGSLEEFVTELKSGTLSVGGFSEALLAAQVQQKEEGIFGGEGRLTSLSQTQGVMANVDGVSENLKLSSGQAKAIMTDMMKKLNESDLSDNEKLQLMDKIDWNMPVQDILANIQHAIDTGNINSAFIDTTGLEDDSERKSKVLEDYDINESTLDAYTEQLQTTGELAKQHEELADSLEHAKEQFGEESDEAKKARKALSTFDDESEDIAVDLAQTQKGLEALSDGMSKYGDILKNGDKTTLEYAEALGTVKKALADTLNVSEENISNSLIENHLQDIEALAAGDEEALNRLRAAAGQDIVLGFYMSGDSTLTREHMEYLQQKAIELNSLDIEVAANLNDQAFIDTLDEMLWNGELTRDQVNEYLRGIGYEPEFHTEKKEVTLFDTPGFDIPLEVPFIGTIPFKMHEMHVPGYVEVPQLGDSHSSNSSPSSGSPLRRTASPTAPSGQTGISPNYINDAYKPKTSGSGSGGKNSGAGSNTKNNKPKDKDKTEWDYLTDITNDLDRASAAMEKLTKLEDRLYGKNRVSNLKKLQSEYKNYIRLLQREVDLAEDHAKLLRTNAYDENGNLTINGYAYRAGFGQVQFDAAGNLENGKAIEHALTDRVNAAVADYNAHRNDEDADTAYYEDRIRLAQEDHDGFMKALSDYESTLGTIEDGQNQIQEYQEKIQDAADAIVDGIQEGIENVIEAIDNQRDFNKLYRDWMEGGSSYSHFGNNRRYYTEGLAELLSPTIGNRSVFETQVQNLQDRIKDVEDVFDNDYSDADKERLSEAAAQENLQEATENVLDTLKTMVEYYDSLLETINEASEKMDDLIDNRLQAYDNIEDFLDTRLEQIKLLFGEDYGAQVKLYNQKIDTNMSKMVAINDAIEAKQVTVKTLESLEASGKKLSTEEREELRNARDKVSELQEKHLTTETELLQDIASKLTAQASEEMNKMVKRMFGGNDVEWIAQQWEIATRNSNQYLDDYNRAFELQKLQLQYQDLLNNTQETNLNIQQRISNHMNEQLEYMRNKKNLSEYDVKYAQAQLDILQKQIALEEARDNKSQMRLQRNAAGNYDFVYGADEAAVSKATEALIAAQQEAYNLSKQIYLDTYNSAVEAALKTKDMVVEIATDATLDLDEKTERIKYILDNLQDYMDNSSIELKDISINLYNDFIEAENLIAEENLGHLSEIFDELRRQSAETKTSMKKDMEDYWDKDENSARSIWEKTGAKASETLNGMQENSKNIWVGIGESTSTGLRGIETKWSTHESNIKGTLNKIKQGSDTSYSSMQNKINTVLDSIDTRFILTQEKSISSTGEINKATENAFTNMKTQLEDYGKDTDITLESAGDSYNTFVEDSLNYAAGETENLDDTTNNFKDDLGYLNTEIKNCGEEMKTWGDKVETAMNKAAAFVQKGNTLQQWLGSNAVIASMASDSFIDLADAADTVADSFSTMSSEIEDGYRNIGDAVREAVQAYNDLASAARGAESAAISATNAINSIPQPPSNVLIDTGFSNIGNSLLDQVGDFINASRNALKIRNSFGNLGRNSGYFGDGGYFYGDYNRYIGLATGGYTGSWTDHGIDDKSGKLAILHQKELVLNADDTKNMLSAVELVRDIMSNINSIPSLGKISTQNSLGNNVEQRVEINATFPGVTTALEIERALTELADNAYQYTNKYKY